MRNFCKMHSHVNSEYNHCEPSTCRLTYLETMSGCSRVVWGKGATYERLERGAIQTPTRGRWMASIVGTHTAVSERGNSG